MGKQRWDFTLLDTGFFRSGQPFHAGEGGHSRIISHFPPPITTLQGAIRTALATARGWQPGQSENWPEELGDANDLGLLSLHGPYLVWDGDLLLPAPLKFLIKKTPGSNTAGRIEIETAFLEPGENFYCDLGKAVCLPRKKEKLDGGRLPENLYLTRVGYNDVAAGRKPSQNEIYFQRQLWLEEARVGLKINPETRTAKEQNLYRIGHIRPEHRLKIRVIVDGLPPGWPAIEQQVVPLGGEGRLAAAEVGPVSFEDYQGFLPACPGLNPARDGEIRYTLSLITPLPSTSKVKLEQIILNGPLNAPGKCISACIGKPQLYGGWDLKDQEPRPLQPYLPPGSTWFFSADAAEKEKIKALHGHYIDDNDKRTLAYGYGQILIGTWEVD